MDRNEYISAVKDLIRKDAHQIDTGTTDVQYLDGHAPRFHAQLDMFEQFLDKEEIKTVYDIGTFAPFVSYYFNLTQQAIVVLGCMDVKKDEWIGGGVKRIRLNLNKPFPVLPKADLLICTECLEHVATNLYRVRQALCESVANGKYLLLSFPLNGKNAQNYDHELPQSDNVEPHLREFTEQTAREFYIGTGFTLISEKITYTERYVGNIMNVLLKKEVFS